VALFGSKPLASVFKLALRGQSGQPEAPCNLLVLPQIANAATSDVPALLTAMGDDHKVDWALPAKVGNLAEQQAVSATRDPSRHDLSFPSKDGLCCLRFRIALGHTTTTNTGDPGPRHAIVE